MPHDDHLDYLHDGHRHAVHVGHYHEHPEDHPRSEDPALPGTERTP